MATNTGGWLYETNGTPVDKATADNAQARVLEIKQTATSASTDAAKALQTANSYAGQIAQANTTAGEAKGIAQGAEDTADNAASRVDALEVMGGVQPGGVNDAEMALHTQQQGGLFNTALIAQSDERVTLGIDDGGAARPVLDRVIAEDQSQSVNLNTWPGMPANSSGSNVTALVQAAADRAATLGVPLIGRGMFRIEDTITLACETRLSEASFAYYGAGLAVDVTNTFRKVHYLPYVLNASKPTSSTGWDMVPNSIGVRIRNANTGTFHVNGMERFNEGLLLYGEGNAGTTYSKFFLGNLYNNKVGLSIRSDAADGWVTQNQFIGGRFSINPAEGPVGTRIPGVTHIKMQDGATWRPDGNTFIGTSLESHGHVDYALDINGGNNAFIQCRFENPYNTPRVMWRSRAYRNIIRDSSYDGWRIEATAEAGAGVTGYNIIDRGERVNTKTTNYAMTLEDTFLIGDGAGITITLMSPYAMPNGHKIKVKNVNAADLTLAVSGAAGPIDGNPTRTVPRWQALTLMNHGGRWNTI